MGRARQAGGHAPSRGSRFVLFAVVFAVVGGPSLGGAFLVHEHDDEVAHVHRVVAHGPAVLLHGHHHHAGTPLLPAASEDEPAAFLHLGVELQRAMRRLPMLRERSLAGARFPPLHVVLPSLHAAPSDAGQGGHRAPPGLLPPPEGPVRLEVLRV